MPLATVEQEKQWTLVEAALSLPRPLGIACALFGLFALAGYFGNVEAFYRPIVGGPATHPLTALSVLLLGLGVSANGKTQRSFWLERVCMLVVAWIATFRLAEIQLGIDLCSWMTPFHNQVLLDQQMGKSNSMGINSAIMLLSCAIALGLHSLRLPRLSQIAASIAVAIPAVSFTGYAYGLARFHGQMSLLTATAGLGLASATLAMTADCGGLKAILSPYIGGKIARAQTLAGYLIPTGLGYVLVRVVGTGATRDQSLFGLYVVAICWFIVFMVSISAIFHEKADFARRQSEIKLAAAAQTDALTGLPNRRQFFELGAREIERIKRSGSIESNLWVLMIDLDYFKKINDTAGHAVGDKVLIAVAGLLSQSIRKVDLVARLGGEEFAVLVTDTNQSGCERVAESIRQNIELLRVPDWTDVHGPITTSIGCAKLNPTNTLDEALHVADEALYRSKKNGRNQVSCISDV